MSKFDGRDLKANLNWKRRHPEIVAHHGPSMLRALPEESLKAFARRKVREGHHDADWAREWLRRKGCRS
jgi:hypothetical protein